MVCLYLGMKWMLQSVSGFETWRASKDLQTWLPVIPYETSLAIAQFLENKKPSVKHTMEHSFLLVVIQFSVSFGAVLPLKMVKGGTF